MLGMAKRVRARFLLTSTSEVYGDPLQHPQTEEYWGNVNPIGERACYDEGKIRMKSNSKEGGGRREKRRKTILLCSILTPELLANVTCKKNKFKKKKNREESGRDVVF